MNSHAITTIRRAQVLDAQIIDAERQIARAGSDEARRYFSRRLRNLKYRRRKLAENTPS